MSVFVAELEGPFEDLDFSDILGDEGESGEGHAQHGQREPEGTNGEDHPPYHNQLAVGDRPLLGHFPVGKDRSEEELQGKGLSLIKLTPP